MRFKSLYSGYFCGYILLPKTRKKRLQGRTDGLQAISFRLIALTFGKRLLTFGKWLLSFRLQVSNFWYRMQKHSFTGNSGIAQ